MKRRENAPHPGTVLLVALVSAGLTACGSAPEALGDPERASLDVQRIPQAAGRETRDDPARAAIRPSSTRPDAGSIETASARTGDEKVYFNLTADGRAAAAGTPAGGAALIDRPKEAAAVLAALPEDQLIAELLSRSAHEWVLHSGGIGGATGSAEIDPRAGEAARRLVLLGLLRPGRAAAEAESLGEALAFAMSAERSAGERLIAAAYLEGAGRTGEARAVLHDLWPGEPLEAPSRVAAAARQPFAVEGLAFATSIEGPGKYTPAPASQIAPGNIVLVYGEFRGFRSMEEEGREEPAYARAFAASLRLLSPAGKEVDRLDFLPESRGRHVAKEAVEAVNFWARYRIPAELEPGTYRLVIEARDVLGNASATGELVFDL